MKRSDRPQVILLLPLSYSEKRIVSTGNKCKSKVNSNRSKSLRRRARLKRIVSLEVGGHR